MSERDVKRIRMARLPTPLEYLPAVTKHFGNRNPMYFKRDDLTGVAVSGNKIRKLEYLLAEAREQDADVIITAGGVQSNHCRATAAACAKLGLRCHLILRGEPPHPYDGNLLLDRLLGAEIRFYPQDEFKNNYDAILDETLEMYKKRNLHPYYFPIGGSVPTGAWGYVRGFEEVNQQVEDLHKNGNEHFTDGRWYLGSAVGSGGTLAGLLLGKAGLKLQQPDIIGVNVCNTPEYFAGEIRTIIEGFRDKYGWDVDPAGVEPTIYGDYVGEGYAIPYPEVLEIIRSVARREGIVLDPIYTGKAFYGITDLMHNGTLEEGVPIVFIHTGGLFSIFAFRDEFI